MILSYHEFSIRDMYSDKVRDFLLQMKIQDVYYSKFYKEFEYEDTLHYVQETKRKINITVLESAYTIYDKFYCDSFDAHGPFPTYIIEHIIKCNEKKTDIYDFFDDDDSAFVLGKCIGRFKQEMEEEFTCITRAWEIQQDKKEKKRTYGKNKITKRHKKFY